ncbi:hypothetical protein QNH39_07030 [Neobacillus novalis]|uniref:PPC89 centrosome localisation domain-containing protein n=1 Tax=Neobacillus novalis TaxID=220687 RepID=A0AA95MUG7_9BACI|nr:hypothetical protein [Neobacillus novalis]WHY87576.1 hypothetical protein QNH39_07030 [Neobacillus novalis]
MKTAEENLEQEISNIKKDLQFLSRKIGIHDMYLNRINKEREEAERELHGQKYTAEEMMEIVKNLDKWMSNDERHKFLTDMFYNFYNRSNLPRVPEDWD